MPNHTHISNPHYHKVYADYSKTDSAGAVNVKTKTGDSNSSKMEVTGGTLAWACGVSEDTIVINQSAGSDSPLTNNPLNRSTYIWYRTA